MPCSTALSIGCTMKGIAPRPITVVVHLRVVTGNVAAVL